jgi:protein-glutamine gamma-glutamyltransferase
MASLSHITSQESIWRHSTSLQRSILSATVRSILLLLVTFLLDSLLTIGIRPWWLAMSVTIGVASSFLCGLWRVRTRGVLTLGLLGSLSFFFSTSLWTSWSPQFQTALLMEKYGAFCVVLILSFFSTWATLRSKMYAVTEQILIIIATITLLSSHRNFHFEQPKIINSLAWNLSVTPLSVLVVIGGILMAVAFASLHLSFYYQTSKAVSRTLSKAHLFKALCATIGLVLLVTIIIQGVFTFYSSRALPLLSNGVGTASEEGESPLGFENALGGTSQPAAVVRLEGDYRDNPFTPGLYFREQALSSMKNGELVLAPQGFDEDIVRSSISDLMRRAELPHRGERKKLTQSIYLMGSHNSPFAIDYPIAVVPLKPPDRRFVSAYQAQSLVPSYKIEDLKGLKVGNPDWSPVERAHYLLTHPNPRYAEKAKGITEGVIEGVPQVLAVTKYLSKESTYTLKPMHNVPVGEDQVAPYLFGDMRGYCVHFAHATVFLLRSLGIPSRIGTGYLSDLSQAKDGHILLRMSDRHAWAEVYVENHGWVPFDTQPEKVESHADTKVDKDMLEELMGLLGPSAEILPPDYTTGDPLLQNQPFDFSLYRKASLVLLGILFFMSLLGKCLLRYGWRLVPGLHRRVRWAYLSHLSTLADLGFTRQPGESRSRFSRRITHYFKENSLSLLPEYAHFVASRKLTPLKVDGVIVSDKIALSTPSRLARLVAWINPRSLFLFVTGRLT